MKMVEESLIKRWRLGQRIDKALLEESQHGDGYAQRLAASLRISVQSLYKCRAFFVSYTEAELRSLLQRRMANGNHITWSHLNHLTTVPTIEVRKKLIEAVFSQSLCAAELFELIRSNNSDTEREVSLPVSSDDLEILIVSVRHYAELMRVLALPGLSTDETQLLSNKLQSGKSLADGLAVRLQALYDSLEPGTDAELAAVAESMGLNDYPTEMLVQSLKDVGEPIPANASREQILRLVVELLPPS